MTQTHERTPEPEAPDPPREFRNQWLEGPFAPVEAEVTSYDLKVTGSIPAGLDGRLLRVGPNPVDPENPVTYNWFTGNGMVHGVRIRDGKAEWYRNRFVRDDEVARSRGLDPLPGPRQLGGDFGGSLNGSWTGHPHRDPHTGELHGMTYYHGWDYVSYQVLDAMGKVRRTVDVPTRGRPVVHDMALTERYAIFLDGPVAYCDELLEKGYDFPFMWGFEYPTRWVLVPRDGVPGDVISCEVERWAVFHILGAYDLPDGRVALIGPSNSRMFVTDRTGPGEVPGKLNLYLIDPAAGKTEVKTLDDRPQEMPRLDDRLVGAKFRYGYFSSRDQGVSTLIKQDRPGRDDPHTAPGPDRLPRQLDPGLRARRTAKGDGAVTHSLPADVMAELKSLDPAITPELAQATWALLTPFHEKIGYTAPRIDRDLTYGDHPRQRLDVHSASPGGTPSPVVVFVHGGGFVRGDKHLPGSPAYDLVGAWAVRHGWIGVTMTYRLAPEYRWPAGAQDVAGAVGWIRDNIAGYGGAPDKIVVAGNSAGAVHVASFLAGQGGSLAGGSLAGVKGGALLSGIYDLSPGNRGEPEHVYYGDTPAETASTLPGLLTCPVPLLFSVAERDPETFQAQAAGVVAAWQTWHGSVPDLVWVEGHNHMSMVASLGIDEAALGVPLARFIERCTGGTTA